MIARVRSPLFRGLSIATFFAVCGCGGGGGGSAPPAGPPTPTPPGTATFTLRHDATSSITGGKRRPRYVSSSTASLALVVNGAGSPTILNLFDTTRCDASGNCTISLQAPAGNDTFLISAYDGDNASGNLLSRATVQATIVPGGTSVISAVLNGVVSKITVALANPNPALHQAATDALTVTAKDAQNNVIVGPGGYLNPIALTNSDTSGHSSLTKTTLNGPGDSAALQYDGAYSAGTVTASAQGVAQNATVPFSPTIATTETALPSGHTAGDIIVGSDGALWFVSVPNMIGRITTGGAISEFAIPAGWDVRQVCVGPDGAIWIGAQQGGLSGPLALIRRAADGSYTTYALPTANWTFGLFSLLAGPDGNFWFLSGGRLNRVTPAGVYTPFQLKDSTGTTLYFLALVAGPDGALWLAEFTGAGLDRYDIASGTVTSYGVRPLVNGAPFASTPDKIVVGPDSRLYFNATVALMSSDTAGSMTTLFQPANHIGYTPLTFASDGALWFTTGPTSAGKPAFGRLSGTTEVPVLGSSTLSGFPPLDSMVKGPDQALWYTRGTVIGRMVP